MYLCKQRLKCSFPELGRAFGNRDHTTVMSAVRKVEASAYIDPEVRAHLEALERKLAGRRDFRSASVWGVFASWSPSARGPWGASGGPRGRAARSP
jgi:hypothetical protein